MSLSVDNYGQQAVLYQLMRRNSGSQQESSASVSASTTASASAKNAAPVPTSGVSLSLGLAVMLGQLGGQSSQGGGAQNSPPVPPASLSSASAQDPLQDLDSALQAIIGSSGGSAYSSAEQSRKASASDLQSVLDMYSAHADHGIEPLKIARTSQIAAVSAA